MKKSLFLAVAAAALLASSCSNDEVISVPRQAAIGFDTFVNKTTRATDATNTNLTSMSVYGYIGDATPVKNFNGTIVSRPDQSAVWTYSPLQYWTADKKYFFTALSSPVLEGNSHYRYTWADALQPETAGFYGSGTISFDNTAPTAASGNEDLVYAYATKETPTEITSDPGTVQFTFKHALSRVKFTFNNVMGSNAYVIKVYDLTINNATATADLTLGVKDPVWENHANTTVLTMRNSYFTPQEQTAVNAQSIASGTKFIIPGQSTLNITFKVDLMLGNGTVLATYNHIGKALPATEFLNGHSYNFVADLNPDNIDPDNEMFPIVFTVIDVEDWIEESAIPVTGE